MRLRPPVIAALLIAFALVRMAATFRVYSATVDEATHVGAGLELFEFHRYVLQRENPPLVPVVLAAAPYLAGMRFVPSPTNGFETLHTVFYDHGKYEHNLVIARLGTLLFFALAALTVWILARRALGDGGALIALLLFTTEPIVLGYSALATHDAACIAGVGVALIAFLRWLREPNLPRASLFGAAYGFSVLCKFTCIADVPVACIVFALIRLIRDRELRRRVLPATLTMIPAAIVTLLTIWAGYLFATGPRGDLSMYEFAYGPRVVQWLSHIQPQTRIPAPQFFIGIANLLMLNQSGLQSYFFGQVRMTGFLWYFPFAVLVKTSLAALALFLGGLWSVRREPELRKEYLEWSLAGLALIAIAMTTTVDIGVRYVLPFYLFFAIATAAAVLAMMRSGIAAKRIAIALIAIHCGVSLLAHPDYFPYFNVLAGRDPSRYLIDSNLDWGQDVLRLRKEVRRLKITRLGVSLFGPAELEKLGFPAVYSVDPWKPANGWIAVSDQSRRITETENGWKWLPSKSFRRVGKSIALYHFPE
jgi:4-amino-4-deoxy-L-arabinose transferase-like glycosyltransferase